MTACACTGVYDVLEKQRAGTDPADLSAADRRIFDDGLVLILKELHDKLDAAVALPTSATTTSSPAS